MQVASAAAAEDSNAKPGSCKPREISTSKMVNHKDSQALYEGRKARMQSDSCADDYQRKGKGSIPSKQTTVCSSQMPLHKTYTKEAIHLIHQNDK